MSYVSSLTVTVMASRDPPEYSLSVYDANGGGLNVYTDGDINKGFGGSYTYLSSQEVSNINMAARGFQVWNTSDRNNAFTDMASGAGGNYRYQEATMSGTPVTAVALLRTQNAMTGPPSQLSSEFPHISDDINSGRGGDFLYIMWGPA